MRHQAILFDLDGTLADTLDDITAAGNHMLAQMGRPTIERDRYRHLAGQGVGWLVREALDNGNEDELERAQQIFENHYAVHQHQMSRPYPGVIEMLDALQTANLTMAVLSNKPDALTKQLVEQLFDSALFPMVVGAKKQVPLKPDPTAALAIMEQLNLSSNQWAYLGDTRVDMLTARSADMFAIGCTWGFRSEQELRANGAQTIVHHPREVLSVLRAADDFSASAKPARHSK